jgi:hypothetical protein
MYNLSDFVILCRDAFITPHPWTRDVRRYTHVRLIQYMSQQFHRGCDQAVWRY